MDYRHQQIQDCFFNTCKQHGMINVDPTPLLAMHDNSVYFVSATITGLKDMLLKNEIPNNGVYLYQPCFRLQNIHDPFYNGTKIDLSNVPEMGSGTIVKVGKAGFFEIASQELKKKVELDKPKNGFNGLPDKTR